MPQDTLQQEIQSALGDEYAITSELPRGGMSRVFVATETALNRVVVIKVLSPELAATLSAERFKREIALAARLQHPHIVPLLAAGVAGGHLYYTMPLVDGHTLRERMRRERPMAIADICHIVSEVADALAYAHREGVVHRDIKPENVMFFHGQAVVLDFGIGKALIKASTAETELRRITQVGMSLGTPTYVAPEQASGDAALDHRADLYALGVVAYEMITGHPPFTGRTPTVVLKAHAEKAPAPMRERRTELPQALDRIIMQCLEKSPADRPATGLEIVRALAPAAAATQPRGAVAASLARAPLWLPWVLTAVFAVSTLLLALLVLMR